MDELDRRLIIELQADPRQSNTRLAKSLGISKPTVSKRIERLVSSSELVLTVLPNMKRFGYSTSAYIGLQIREPSRLTAIAEQLCQFPEIRWVSSCAGFADIFVRGDFTSLEALTAFITNYLGKIDGISRIDTMVELQNIKYRTFGRIENRDLTNLAAYQTGNITIDELDHHLIVELQKDCRTPLKKLALQVDISKATVFRHINN